MLLHNLHDNTHTSRKKSQKMSDLHQSLENIYRPNISVVSRHTWNIRSQNEHGDRTHAGGRRPRCPLQTWPTLNLLKMYLLQKLTWAPWVGSQLGSCPRRSLWTWPLEVDCPSPCQGAMSNRVDQPCNLRPSFHLLFVWEWPWATVGEGSIDHNKDLSTYWCGCLKGTHMKWNRYRYLLTDPSKKERADESSENPRVGFHKISFSFFNRQLFDNHFV